MTLVALMTCITVTAGNSRAISREELPAKAQKIISASFPKRKAAMMTLETGLFEKTKYNVVFTNGDKIEFDETGNWTEVSSKSGSVPASIVPAGIRTYMRGHYPKARIKEIDKGRSKYEVKLSNGLEITFDNDMRVIEIDD